MALHLLPEKWCCAWRGEEVRQVRPSSRSLSLIAQRPSTRDLGWGKCGQAVRLDDRQAVIHIRSERTSGGDPWPTSIERMFVEESDKRRCSFQGCGRPHLARGLCRGHYEQQRLVGSLKPLRPRRRGDPACKFEGCGNVAVNKGLCQAHANQRKKGQPLRPLRPFYGTQGPCRFDGCAKPRAAGGFCAGHAAQYYGGRPLAPLFKPKVGCDFPGSLERFEEVHHKNGESAAIIGQRTSNCGPAACSRPGAASAT